MIGGSTCYRKLATGEPAAVRGARAWGEAARTAMGQRGGWVGVKLEWVHMEILQLYTNLYRILRVQQHIPQSLNSLVLNKAPKD